MCRSSLRSTRSTSRAPTRAASWQQLTQHDVLVEAFGGEVPAVPVSARTREGLDNLLETIILVSEIQDLKANPDREARGAIVEAELTTNRGPVATLLVQSGTLRTGNVVIAGDATGKIRAMFDDHDQTVTEAGPSDTRQGSWPA